ncbi:NADPH-dependent FMN reductase [Pseudoroseicyclus tamaricis]|uniref:NAD(P)H-dependent oxidoreductase n=1 Tax=Pseudoroseicyclus tamaricis TaxID=2705421 RepID=A0A6B2JTK0_9RHOB|nr:NAD(P)H-dependent oxidoreductase [Pseudoroseicyclus tamaricis]NDV01285.1 NAD(P)H-dependent oxidoreductase [Pseudoroseicyclus tamaricis]
MLRLKTVIGSTRPTRKGPAVAEWVHRAATAHGAFDAELVDLASFELPLLDEPAHPAMHKYEHEHTRAWSAKMKQGDVYLFVTPEYDFFAPASLVNALQCLSTEWNRKAAGVISYGGVSGGLRSAQELRILIANQGMMPLKQTVPVPFFGNLIEEDTLKANEEMEKGLSGLLDELAVWGEALKPLRN